MNIRSNISILLELLYDKDFSQVLNNFLSFKPYKAYTCKQKCKYPGKGFMSNFQCVAYALYKLQ